ncbi:hypothetical protein MRB53_019604 [Persea americana]|uniref:Uncharacterized protein n=1 Tax=Persea americana TaxID=3435 RepID=A0ACC2KZP5_PERAE|nr:hypothetical protein MRB53_019604 [Persea americana]
MTPRCGSSSSTRVVRELQLDFTPRMEEFHLEIHVVYSHQPPASIRVVEGPARLPSRMVSSETLKKHRAPSADVELELRAHLLLQETESHDLQTAPIRIQSQRLQRLEIQSNIFSSRSSHRLSIEINCNCA